MSTRPNTTIVQKYAGDSVRFVLDNDIYVPKDPDVHSTVGSRYADLAELDANENPIVFHQVGRTTKGQQPVARERSAINDLLDRTGVPVVFHSYNDPNYKPTIFEKKPE